jgi:hypothetical protein
MFEVIRGKRNVSRICRKNGDLFTTVALTSSSNGRNKSTGLETHETGEHV